MTHLLSHADAPNDKVPNPNTILQNSSTAVAETMHYRLL
jgi:hypothetical protein